MCFAVIQLTGGTAQVEVPAHNMCCMGCQAHAEHGPPSRNHPNYHKPPNLREPHLRAPDLQVTRGRAVGQAWVN